MAFAFNPLISEHPDLAGRSVLITGGTGSFGTAFARRLLDRCNPDRVILLSRDEQKHHRLMREIGDPRLRYFVGDVRDADRLQRAFTGVDYVVHAAAMKHVHIAEYNPIEAIRTNVDGAANIANSAIDRGVERVVALSTDKAVSPLNLYGATKLCMEKLVVASNAYSGRDGTRFDLVRYGNVVGSAGSVVPVFLQQRDQGRITVTDPSMTRFWIGMERAVDLVLLALTDALGGEIFVPKLPACTIGTLAEAIAPDVPVEEVGARPGEKLHEVMITEDESGQLVEYDTHFVVRPTIANWGLAPRESGTQPNERFT
ncbi:MAG: UDP-N-acetylglucosamine 4,6-dehydratase (inverting), partial [Planctomycetota bacterium]